MGRHKKPIPIRHERLKPLSTYGLPFDDVVKAFMKVDPKRVRKRMVEEGIVKK